MSPKQLPVNGQSISLFRLSNDERSVVSGKVVEIKDDLVWIDLPPGKQISQAQKLIGCEFLLRWGKENSTHDLPVVVRDVSKDNHLGLSPRSDEKREFMRVESSLPMEFRIIHEDDRADAEREVMAAATETSELEIETDRFWHQEDLGDRLEGEFGQIGRFLTQLDAKLDYLIDLAEGKEPQRRPAHRVHSLDISGNGISFLYDQSLDEDTLMVVTVEISQFPHAEAKVLGRVKRCLPHASGGKSEYEIGINFELLRDDTQELIFRFISRAERKMLRMRRELLNSENVPLMNRPANPTEIDLEVDGEETPCRLDRYLADNIETLSRTRIKKLIIDGHVTVDGEHVKPRHELQGDEQLHIVLPEPDTPMPQGEDIPLDILHEDEALLVINKATDMIVHPGSGVRDGTLVNALIHYCGENLAGYGQNIRPGIVHRLDRQTSGCLVVAKTLEAQQVLSAQLADHSMSRCYEAWLVGDLSEKSGRVEAPIGRSPRNRTLMSVVRSGRHAATNWRVLAWAPGLTRVECRLETGRTHQIRVHMKHYGHPVIGDQDYGYCLREAKMRVPPAHAPIVQALAGVKRQLLHARRLSFVHPLSGEQVCYEAPLPEDFEHFDRVLDPYCTWNEKY